MRVDVLTGNSGADLFIIGRDDNVTDFFSRNGVVITDGYTDGYDSESNREGDVIIWID
jgi:hypothetical protein